VDDATRQPAAGTFVPRVRVRWWIFAYMCAFAMIAYVQRTSVSIASEKMLPELHFDQIQLGWLNTAFTTAYALSQLPGGVFGLRFGARTTYTVIGLLALVATLMTPVAPYLTAGVPLFLALLVAQSLLGVSQGPIFPVFAGVLEAWFPVRRWALAQGLQTACMNVGGAITPVLVVYLMSSFGWRAALVAVAVPVGLVTVGWAWYGRNRPQEHPRVTAAELAELDAPPEACPPLTLRRLRGVLGSRDVWALAVSYLCINFVFYLISYWSFLYLVQVRHLSGIESGVAAMLPWIGAAVGAAVGGYVSDWCAERLGPRWGYRLLPMVSLPLVAVMLLVTTQVSTAYGAVAALVVTFGLVELNEGAYWATTMRVSRTDTAAAAGVLNTGGNVGGIVCQPIVAYLSASGAWNVAFITGTVFAVCAALLWLGIDPARTGPSAERTAAR
jgi:ACS family glucarate transporter-like MFS transporter